MLCSHYTQAQIADIIGCSQSTISRELKRNSLRGKYGAEAAHRKALAKNSSTVTSVRTSGLRSSKKKERFGDLEVDLVIGKVRAAARGLLSSLRYNLSLLVTLERQMQQAHCAQSA